MKKTGGNAAETKPPQKGKREKMTTTHLLSSFSQPIKFEASVRQISRRRFNQRTRKILGVASRLGTAPRTSSPRHRDRTEETRQPSGGTGSEDRRRHRGRDHQGRGQDAGAAASSGHRRRRRPDDEDQRHG